MFCLGEGTCLSCYTGFKRGAPTGFEVCAPAGWFIFDRAKQNYMCPCGVALNIACVSSIIS